MAEVINRRLLEHAETKLNGLSAAVLAEEEAQARRDLSDAEADAAAANAALTRYRLSRRVLDPEREAVIPLEVVGRLEDEVSATRNLLAVVRKVAPENPQIGPLQQKLEDLAAQVRAGHDRVAGRGPQALATLAEGYAPLRITADAANKMLGLATAALSDARHLAHHRQVYFERVAEPSRPDAALEPYRLRGVLATALLGLILYGVLRLLLAAVREHTH